jgi:hypothetical protein
LEPIECHGGEIICDRGRPPRNRGTRSLMAHSSHDQTFGTCSTLKRSIALFSYHQSLMCPTDRSCAMKAKEASRGKRGRKTLPVLGAAGLSLSLAGGAHAAIDGMAADMPALQGAVGHEIALCEEEVSDISLATFQVFGKENSPRLRMAGGACACAYGSDANSSQPASRGPAYAPRPRPTKPAQPDVRALKHPQVPATQNTSQRPQPETRSTTNQSTGGPVQQDAGASKVNQSASQQGGAEVPSLGDASTSN